MRCFISNDLQVKIVELCLQRLSALALNGKGLSLLFPRFIEKIPSLAQNKNAAGEFHLETHPWHRTCLISGL